MYEKKLYVSQYKEDNYRKNLVEFGSLLFKSALSNFI